MILSKCLNIRTLLFAAIFISFANAKTTLLYEKFQRLNSPANSDVTDDWVGIGLYTYRDSSKREYKLDFDARLNIKDTDDYNYSPVEMFYSFKFPENTLRVGKQVLNWSPNEKFWGLGHLNPVQSFSLLDEKQEGILGVNWQHQVTKKIKFDFFFSYFYIPQLNPSIDIVDGKVVTSSEWVRTPPNFISPFGRFVPIRYEVARPAYSDIIFQKSLGGNLEYSWGVGRANFYGIYKPENQIRINAESDYLLLDDELVVKAHPAVNHHIMFGLSVDQKIGNQVKVTSGFDIIDPNAKLGKDFEIIDPVQLEEKERDFQSSVFKIEPNYNMESYFHFSTEYDRDFLKVSANYIQLLNNIPQGNDDFYGDTVKWRQAVGLKGEYQFSDKIDALVKFQYDLLKSDNILQLKGGYSPYQFLKLSVGADLIKSPHSESFWSSYRANDRVYSSIQYIF